MFEMCDIVLITKLGLTGSVADVDENRILVESDEEYDLEKGEDPKFYKCKGEELELIKKANHGKR